MHGHHGDFIGTLVYIEIFSRTFSLTGVAGAAGDDVRHDADFHQIA